MTSSSTGDLSDSAQFTLSDLVFIELDMEEILASPSRLARTG
jgi:hypothetical protein